MSTKKALKPYYPSDEALAELVLSSDGSEYKLTFKGIALDAFGPTSPDNCFMSIHAYRVNLSAWDSRQREKMDKEIIKFLLANEIAEKIVSVASSAGEHLILEHHESSNDPFPGITFCTGDLYGIEQVGHLVKAVKKFRETIGCSAFEKEIETMLRSFTLSRRSAAWRLLSSR